MIDKLINFPNDYILNCPFCRLVVETLGHLNKPTNKNSRKVTKVVRIKLSVRVLNVSSLPFFIIINYISNLTFQLMPY